MLKSVVRLLVLALPAGAVAFAAAPAYAGGGDAAEAQSWGAASYCVQVS